MAQQALHHLEDYVTVTPINYIQERFRQGLDAEVLLLLLCAVVVVRLDAEVLLLLLCAAVVVGLDGYGRLMTADCGGRSPN